VSAELHEARTAAATAAVMASATVRDLRVVLISGNSFLKRITGPSDPSGSAWVRLCGHRRKER